MFLFQQKNEVEIAHKCKLCMQEFKITITRKEYEGIEGFPIGKEFIHGEPPHKLVLYIDKNLEVEKFKIEDVIQKKEDLYAQELTKKVLKNIELTDEEIELYFLTTGRGVVSLAEISLLINKSKEESEKIAEKFIEKGLYKKILGASPHYFTLPPYAALVSQLHEFQVFVSDIDSQTSSQLEQSFSQLEAEAEGTKKIQEFGDFVTKVKRNMLMQIKVQKDSVDTAIADVDNIKNINKIIGSLREDVQKAINTHIQMVGKKKLKEELGSFFNRFSVTLEESLEKTMSSIDQIVNTAETAKENVRTTFADVSKNISKVLMDVEEKISNIAEGVSESFGNLKNTFSTKVVGVLKEMLSKISKRLEISEITTKNFWEQAKQITLFTMRDVWFIKSVEGIKSQIKDEVPKAKMRLLIVAPQITDIDVESLKQCSSRVNIRIATFVDIHNGSHQEIIKKLNDIPNVDIRLRKEQDLWGINKDSEVIIICALSRKEGEIAEIAGIGTATQEHIRIFVPVIEDAWMSASKHIGVLRHAL